MTRRKVLDGKATALMVVLCAIWGMQQIALKAAATDMAPILQLALRSGLAAPFILLLVFMRGDAGALSDDTWKPGTVVGLLFGIEFLFVGEGLRFTSASHMAIFLYTAPIFAALGLHIRLLDERLEAAQWCGIGLAFFGVVVSFTGRGPSGPSGGETAWLGDVCGIAAAISWAATTLTVRFSKLTDAPATVTLLYQLVGACALLLTVALLTGEYRFTVSPTLLASLAFQTVMVSLVSFLVWFTLLRIYLASRLGVLSFLTPLFGVVFGVVILGEKLDTPFLIGASMVLAGILTVSAGRKRQSA